MQKYDPDQPLFSIHIPKCGGRSFREILELWFGEHFYPHYIREHVGEYPESESFKVVHDSAGPRYAQAGCVHGHFNKLRNVGISSQYPHARQYMTFLRDPLEVAISNYYFVNTADPRREGRSVRIDMSLERYLRFRVDGSKSPYWPHFPDAMDGEDYLGFVSEHFVFIGIVERYQLSVDVLARILGKPVVEVPHINASDVERDRVRADVRALYRSRFEREYELYESANRQLDSIARHYGLVE